MVGWCVRSIQRLTGGVTRRVVALTVLLAVLVSACGDDVSASFEFATVTTEEVVQTVSAPGRLQPREQAELSAPVAAMITEMFVMDGQEVRAGEPLLRLSSDTLDEQIAQLQGLVDAADAFTGAVVGAGADTAPTIAAVRTQFDATVPLLLGGLATQSRAAQTTLDNAVAAVAANPQAAAVLNDALRTIVDGGVDAAELLRTNPGALEQLLGVDVTALLAPIPATVNTPTVLDTLVAARQAVDDTQAQLAQAEAAFAVTSVQLAEAEQAARQRDQSTAVLQRQLVQVQSAQSQALLANAESRRDELIVTAPIGGLVELVRGGDAGVGGLLDGLPGFLSALPGLDDLAGLLPGGAGGGSNVQSVLEVGAAVATGQLLVRLYDRSSFTVVADVDEIDVIELAVGQPATVRLDAFPGELFSGVVTFVSFSSRNDLTGGALYSVGIELDDAPQRLQFRSGFRASADIEVRRLVADTVVPTSALLRRGFREVVFVVDGNRVREVPVEIVAIGEDTAAVTGFVNPNDQVVTRGVELLSDGDAVSR
jgi:multidrug efflux pump subunit AcrA (membrane-fusion protein)